MAGLAEENGGDETAVRLARITGLLHDIGRFPQYRRYQSWDDGTTVDHAQLGAKICARMPEIDRMPEGMRSPLLEAIRLHNRTALPNDLPPPTKNLVRLLRDADKLDIFAIFRRWLERETEGEGGALGAFPEGPPSPELLLTIENGHTAPRRLRRTKSDILLQQLSWVFDMNFHGTRRRFAERGFFEAYRRRLPQDPGTVAALRRIENRLHTEPLPV
jgi:hypothetical protein